VDAPYSHGPSAVALPTLKLAVGANRGFWEVPVLFEDAHLLALDKPAGLLVSPDRYDRERPNLMRLLLDGLAAGKPWASERGLTYIANAHRLDFETSGVLLLAKDKPTLVRLAEQFGNASPRKTYVALCHGTPPGIEFDCDLKLRPDHRDPARMRWATDGKKSFTRFKVLEDFGGILLMECRPETGRTHQIRVHLKASGVPIYGDPLYGDGVRLFLSQIKRGYRPKSDAPERPLTPRLALHAWKLELPHPVTGVPLAIEAPWPDDLEVALKHLRKNRR
jgi:RluA family pseudouridine synthase